MYPCVYNLSAICMACCGPIPAKIRKHRQLQGLEGGQGSPIGLAFLFTPTGGSQVGIAMVQRYWLGVYLEHKLV